MVPETIIYQSAAIVTAAALSSIAIEARWAHKTLLRHDRQLGGTEYRKGIVQLVNKHLRGKNEN